jgi:hypothetical protein
MLNTAENTEYELAFLYSFDLRLIAGMTAVRVLYKLTRGDKSGKPG